ncbi:hypothetical protein SAMN05216326_11416 [Nitrosomonas marina]|uniref:Uncharacterized protein n=1 Tax=Nitrosomonas marina TaxID=917 RepID=A0A1I0CBH9_9PROT|nr:hypothetical protein [Nitrosomonas marina]SET16873.1 hypothetical protein SAMN05216326_11416 [Nitrosomonas marina]
MAAYTVKKINNQCQIIEIGSNGSETVISDSNGEVSLGGNTYKAVIRQSDAKCCVFRLPPDLGAQNHPEFILEEGQIKQG